MSIFKGLEGLPPTPEQIADEKDSMLAPGNIVGETKTRGKALAFMNNSTALLGVLVFGFPITTANVCATVFSFAQIAATIMQLVLRYFRPQGASHL